MKLFKKLIFVIPWYGKYATGGAEIQCKTLAEQLHKAGFQVEVFTTCSKQFPGIWKNDYEAGTYNEEGLVVRRFKIDKRDINLFNNINNKILSSATLSESEEYEFFKNNINSIDMMNAIEKDSENLFIFIPYLYGTTFFGYQIHPHRSVMIPCLHDEGYARMKLMKNAIINVRALSFNSQTEKDLAISILGKLPFNEVLAEGIELEKETEPDPTRFKKKYNLDKFILCAGRKDKGKNTPLLIDYFCKFLEKNNTDLKLVLTGQGKISIPPQFSKNILDLFLTRSELYDAYSAATLLCLPSVNESFSRVIMESWLNNTPVLVHNQCGATKEHCLKSNGGLYFDNFNEFEECVKFFLNNPKDREKLAENGRNYVLQNFNWDKIINAYSEFFNHINSRHKD